MIKIKEEKNSELDDDITIIDVVQINKTSTEVLSPETATFNLVETYNQKSDKIPDREGFSKIFDSTYNG